MLQCGDPSGTGSGGPTYTIPDENLPTDQRPAYPEGVLAMANTGSANSGSSQFFFVYGNTRLNPAYTPFGRVTSGLGILKRIAKQGSTPPGDGTPHETVVIESFTVTRGG